MLSIPVTFKERPLQSVLRMILKLISPSLITSSYVIWNLQLPNHIAQGKTWRLERHRFCRVKNPPLGCFRETNLYTFTSWHRSPENHANERVLDDKSCQLVSKMWFFMNSPKHLLTVWVDIQLLSRKYVYTLARLTFLILCAPLLRDIKLRIALNCCALGWCIARWTSSLQQFAYGSMHW